MLHRSIRRHGRFALPILLVSIPAFVFADDNVETIRYRDALFFRAPVRDQLLVEDGSASWRPTMLGAPCAVLSGPAFQVYLTHESGDTGHPYVAGRFRESGEIRIELPEHALRGKASSVRVLVSPPAAETDSPPSWVLQWARALHVAGSDLDTDPAHERFLRGMLERRFGATITAPRPQRMPWGGNLPSPFEIFTGSAAIRESIQLDRTVDGGDPADASVPIAEIEPLALKDHPFDEMRAGRPFRGSELAGLCPRDAIYVRVKSLAEWFRIMDLTNRWGGSLLSTIQVRSRDFDIADRYTRQLGLGNELMARLLGTKVIGEFALVASDPLFYEGTGVAVIFRPLPGKDREFQAMFRAQRTTQAASPGVTRTDETIQDVDVDFLRDARGSLRSYSFELGSARVFSNSHRLATRIIDASRSEETSMASAPDYRYYRALYPLDERESGFAYLSQDWFRFITGPAWRIARGRRGALEHELADLRYAWQWALIEQTPTDVESLTASRFVASSPRRLGRALGLGDEIDVASLLALGPLPAVAKRLPVKATSEEASSYKRFRDGYARYWRRYIDPVGIRLRVTEQDIEAETLILPLIQNSIYGGLRELTGATKTPGLAVPLPEDALGAMTLSWSPAAARVDRFLGSMVNEYYSARVPIDPTWFGRTLTLGVADGDLFLTARSSALNTFTGGLGLNSGEGILFSALLSSLTLPVFAAVELENSAAVGEMLERVFQSAARQDRSRGFFHVDYLHYQTAGRPAVHTLTVTFAFVEFRFHFAFVDRWLLVTTRPALLERWIETIDGTDGQPAAFTENGRLQIFPQAFKLAARTAGMVWQERVLDGCLENFAGLGRAAAAGRFDSIERASEFLGYRPTCPEGGTYGVAGEGSRFGEVRCSVHGSAASPTVPSRPPENAPAVRFVNDMRSVRVDFAFTDDGLRSRVRVKTAR